MQTESFDGSKDRRILIGMVVDPLLLGRLSHKWDHNLFADRWSNVIGGWCVTYYLKYGKAPCKDIRGLYESWAETANDVDSVKLVEQFLTSLNNEYESLAKETNSEYLVDLASKHFDTIRLERLLETIKADLVNGELDKAKNRVQTYGDVQLGHDAATDVLQDLDALQETFDRKRDPIVEYDGAIGQLLNPALERDAFVAFMGPHKRGKTWWLMDLAWRAMLQRRKVAFFQVGDLSRAQVLMRFACRAERHPFMSRDGWPLTIQFPLDIKIIPGAPTAIVDLEQISFTDPLSLKNAVLAFKETEKRLKSKVPLLKLFCYPNSTISVKGIESVLQQYDRQGWTPDVIVIDYADILAPITKNLLPIEQINETWKAMRALSQSRHCLLVTASQTNANSFDARVLTRKNFSGNHLKFAHITAAFGLNQEEEEREKGIMRINCLSAREFEYAEHKCVHVAGCLPIANPAVRSCW